MRYVIVGNSFAGTFAAESIRQHDRQGEIVIVSDENERVYSRALIHEYLGGVVGEERMHLRDEHFADRLDLTMRLGERVEALRADTHEVVVNGQTLAYDKLLIATGGSPFVPPGMNGLKDFEGSVFTFTTMADARELARLAVTASKIVVLGAGLIGMQAADAFATLGKDVTVVELADQILPLALDRLSAELVQEEMEHHGMTFRTSESVVQLKGQDGVLESVELKSGLTIPADLFVIAVGVRPNVAWLKESGLTIDRGIVVDDHLRTNLPDVYAAGDCAQGFERLSGSNMVLATIPIASEQGLVAGLNMAGADATYKGGVPLNALQFSHLQIVSYGYVKETAGQEVLSLLDENKSVYKKIVLQDNRVVGALFVRAIDQAGLFRYLMENRIDVSSFKQELLSDEFGAAMLPQDVREKMFCTRQSRLSAVA
jgi:NAD(P)H-nitrite reductase large subunit